MALHQIIQMKRRILTFNAFKFMASINRVVDFIEGHMHPIEFVVEGLLERNILTMWITLDPFIHSQRPLMKTFRARN